MCSKWEKWLQGREREFTLKEKTHRKKKQKQNKKQRKQPEILG